jgi:pterin-4a-carbinolamine dehydratase
MPADLDTLASHTISRTTVEPAQLADELASLGARWSADGRELRLELRDGKMARYGEIAAYAALIADEMDHHPKIVLEYGKLTLAIHTHDTQAITVTDLVFAARLETWLRDRGW